MTSFFKQCVCLTIFLSFSVFGEQEGICVDCVKGDSFGTEIQNFKKLTCEAQLKLPECKNVPHILRPDCNNLPKDLDVFAPSKLAPMVCGPLYIGSMTAIFFSLKKIFSQSTVHRFWSLGGRLATAIPWVSAAVVASGVGFLAVKLHNDIEQVRREARQRGLDPKNEEGIKKQARQGFYYSLAKKLYDIQIGDSHCYNELIQTARLCGFTAGITGAVGVAGGVAGGGAALLVYPSSLAAGAGAGFGGLVGGGTGALFTGSMFKEVREQYEKVRDDTQKRLQSESSVPSATENLDQLLQEASQ